MIRTRIAPSPTGYPHIGTIYQALFDWAFAKKHTGKFVVRIEDTDRERFVADAEEKLFKAIDWFDLTEDESPRKDGEYGPYRQSERLGIYKKHADQLVSEGKAYFCFCSKERLDELRQRLQKEKKQLMYDKHCRGLSEDIVKKNLDEKRSYVIRMKIPENEKITVCDEIRGEITVDSNTIDEQVLLKSDGYPTYHLASVVDDHLMQITHIVRAEEWISSTPKHVLLYKYFNWETPLFFHTALLRNPDKSKLSKRHGHTDVHYYREAGYLPEAIINYLTLLGWSHPEEKEIFDRDEFVEKFDLKDLKPVGPIFDITKLAWMNGEYIRKMTVKELEEKITTYEQDVKDRESLVNQIDSESLTKIITLSQTRINILSEFYPLVKFFIVNPDYNLSDDEKKVAESLKKMLGELKNWSKDEIFQKFKEVMSEHGVRMPVLYKIITGAERGLPLPESVEILGREKTQELLSKLL